MLFNKDIEPSCSYCEYGKRISEEEVACHKKGVVSSADHCKNFKYDPLKRVPARPVSIDPGKFSDEDFRID